MYWQRFFHHPIISRRSWYHAALGLGALEQISSVAGAKCGDPRHCSCWDPRDCRPALSISQQYLTGTHCISHHLHTSQQWTSQHMSLPHCSKYFNVVNMNLHYFQCQHYQSLSCYLNTQTSWYLPWPPWYLCYHTTVTYLVITDTV